MIEKSIGYLWQRQKVTLDNISNANTPGFKARYVTFEQELRNKMALTNVEKSSQIRSQIESANIFVHTTPGESNHQDGNNVNVDSEEVELARAALQYQYAIKAFNDDYSRMRSVVRA